jgi:5-methylcytosine-specific restriction endonuclease McrA
MPNCQLCGVEFVRHPDERRKRIYCSSTCAQKAWHLVPANKERMREYHRARYAKVQAAVQGARYEGAPWVGCSECATQFKRLREGQKYCSARCSKTAYEKAAKARARSRQDMWSACKGSILAALKEPCGICGASERIHMHHIVPRSNGGEDGRENLVALCQPCHAAVHRSRLYLRHSGEQRAPFYRIEYLGPVGRENFLGICKMLDIAA